MDHFITVLWLFNIFSYCACNEFLEHDPRKELNVILFFTHVDTKGIDLKEDTLSFLNLHEETRVKHSSEDHEKITIKLHQHKPHKERCSTHCKELLKGSLMSLTHFCHTVMKMKTAVASVSSKEMTNDIQEPESPFHTPHLGLDSESVSRSKRSESSETRREDPRREHSQNSLSSIKEKTKSNEKNIITGAKHTEVFQIRIKRESHEENDEDEPKEKEIKVKIHNEVPEQKRSEKHPWDILDIVKHVRYSFLGKIFENTLKNQIKADQEDIVDISNLGKEKKDPGLFSMVKSTLETLLEPPDSTFLMVIFGGHLHAVTDKHSSIVMSIKHVIENTDSQNTLIVVTGSCAEDLDEQDGDIVQRSYSMPVYAKGPLSYLLSECTLLYDIPLTIRKILEDYTKEDVHFPQAIINP